MTGCLIPECDYPETRFKRGMCSHHYRNWHRQEFPPDYRAEWDARKDDPIVITKNRERASAWVLANPERHRVKNRDVQARRRARLRGVRVETVRAAEVLRRSNGLCGLCGKPVDPSDFHVDHIIPLARGGEHSYANTQSAHPPCNIRKQANLPVRSAVAI